MNLLCVLISSLGYLYNWRWARAIALELVLRRSSENRSSGVLHSSLLSNLSLSFLSDPFVLHSKWWRDWGHDTRWLPCTFVQSVQLYSHFGKVVKCLLLLWLEIFFFSLSKINLKSWRYIIGTIVVNPSICIAPSTIYCIYGLVIPRDNYNDIKGPCPG